MSWWVWSFVIDSRKLLHRGEMLVLEVHGAQDETWRHSLGDPDDHCFPS